MKGSKKTIVLFFIVLFAFCFMLGAGVGFYCISFETTPKAIVTNAVSFFTKGSKPEDSVKAYFDCLQKQDTEKAGTYIKKSSDKSKSKVEDNKQQDTNKYEEEVMKAFTSKLTYEIISTKKSGNDAKVRTKITAPNLNKIARQALREVLPTIFAQAVTGEQDNKQVEKIMMERLANSLKDTEVSMISDEIDIELVKDKEKKMWLIVPNEQFFNAATGDLGKIMEELENGIKK